MAELFGFSITRKGAQDSGDTFTVPTPDDGSIEVAGGGFFSSVLDTDGRERTELDLIRRYRDIAQQPECDSAVEDIVNEAITSDEFSQSVMVTLDRLPYPEKIKRLIRKEFDSVLSLLEFEQKGHDIFRRWYVDGRLYHHLVVDEKNLKAGIQEIRYIDSSKMRKVKQVKKKKDEDRKTRRYRLFGGIRMIFN